MINKWRIIVEEPMHNIRSFSFFVFGMIFFLLTATFGQGQAVPSSLTVDQIMAKVEKRYQGSAFSAQFYQISTLKAVEITDTAKGKVWIKRPGMMRWEYESPEKQTIITDGQRLWIYRPEENQVMLGKAPAFFGEGQGASFLSDIKRIRQAFTVSAEGRDKNRNYILRLLPKKRTMDVSDIRLTIDRKSFEVVQLITVNLYKDETRIELRYYRFNQKLNDSFFHFSIPKGVDLLQLDE